VLAARNDRFGFNQGTFAGPYGNEREPYAGFVEHCATAFDVA
jgi:hypothetical protein